ncbi:hypothetical protein PAECIP111891_06721 [Paenibacillus allorhizoplanae]|uniref:DUF3168 domain-containing protein n=1 Tax=Paenibacillus allorhizoplanae TaxID=2905648 RepID=A0ABM9CYA5_9BACL|nr:DUF3168 domain-containing protein [Paenibacillus allorhizoplanae]CAH1230682.1 hypothetical protein PAECIP111891_06721 [Paenibacillus allorhizoplanae]
MRFEEALATELQSIPALENGVFPLVVSEGKQAPYAAYMSNEGMKLKTLAGFIDRKNISAEINIVAKSYPDIKQLTTLVMDKLISFQSRVIGDETGPLIQDVNFTEDPKEGFEFETELYRSTIPFQVYL